MKRYHEFSWGLDDDENGEWVRLDDVVSLLDQHIPSMTDEIEESLRNMAHNAALLTAGSDEVAELALRECACGVLVYGFYEYVDHLKDMLRQAGVP